MSTDDQTRRAHKRPRTSPIRRRIATLLAIPLLSLIGLWGFAASITGQDAIAKYSIEKLHTRIAAPTSMIFGTVQAERSAAAVVLGSGGRRGGAELAAIQARTDGAIAAFRKNALSEDTKESVSPAVWQRVQGFVGQYDRIGPLRAQIASGGATLLEALQGYNDIFDSATLLLGNLSNAQDVGLYRESRAVVDGHWARDYLERENALLGAIQASGRDMTVAEHNIFVQWAANRRHLLQAARANLEPELGRFLQQIVDSPAFSSYESLEKAIVASRGAVSSGTVMAGWRTTVPALAGDWRQQNIRAGEALSDKVGPIGDRIMIKLGIAGGLGLVAVVISIFLSLMFVRDISRELSRLQRAAQNLAQERLPNIVARLRRGEDVNVTAEAPQFRAGRTREIASVVEAFTTVQRTAVDTAVGEAQLRKGISRVFMNLAWRSQSLLHRQLRMLDAMERRATDPDELDDLFRLDHLTTRMRRHAEGLVILSGSPTARGWNQPVPVEDLLRAALSEVEDYPRVDVMTTSNASLTGAVVADVIHLLAELIENATVFSPPTTEVLVRAEIVGNGLAIEVVDRGIGMGRDELADINHRLANPPEFDLADSDRLGLFVVARLAIRHGIKVVLQPSAYGGTTAVVLIPSALVILGETAAVSSAENGQNRQGGRVGGRGIPQLTASGASQGAPSGASGGPEAGPGLAPAPNRLPGSAQALRAPFEPARHSTSGRFTDLTSPTGRHRGLAGPDQGDYGASDHAATDYGTPRPGGSGYRSPGRGSSQAAGTGAGPGTEGDSEETGRLPRRIRQENLAPQLRNRRAPQPAPAEDAYEDDDATDERPEFSRDLMSSLQMGWTRGRDADEDGEDRPVTLFDRQDDRGES